jgi:hypothetical protein
MPAPYIGFDCAFGLGRRLALALIVAAALTLSGCRDDYPREWPAADTPWRDECPQLAGSYWIGNVGPLLRAPSFHDNVLREIIGDNRGARYWETLTISGDPATALELHVSRSDAQVQAALAEIAAAAPANARLIETLQTPEGRWSSAYARMTDAEFAANRRLVIPQHDSRGELRRGRDYLCRDGWLVSPRFFQDYPARRDSSLPPEEVRGEVWFGRSVAGDLIAQERYREQAALNLWCGDGCFSVPMGEWAQRHWRRWKRNEASASADQATPPSVAGDFESSRPILESPEALSVAPRLPDLNVSLRPLLPAGVQLQDILPRRGQAVLVLAARHSDAIVPFFTALERSGQFGPQRVISLQRATGGGVRLQLLLQIPPEGPDTPLGQMQARMLGLLPLGVDFLKLRAEGDRWVLQVYIRDPRQIRALSEAMTADPEIGSFEADLQPPDASGAMRARLRFRERAVEHALP